MALFTGKGDGGTTKVFGCDQQRISKSSELPEALGALDELNAYLGYVKARCDIERIKTIIHDTQETLFIVQAETAGAPKQVKEGTVATVSEIINGIEKEIPPITAFSISGGTELSALLLSSSRKATRGSKRSRTSRPLA
jgi:cob(I)alamin adenosyltransferase